MAYNDPHTFGGVEFHPQFSLHCFPPLTGGSQFPFEVTHHHATPEELEARNAFLRTPEGKEQVRKEYVALWRERLEKAKEELRKLGESV